MKIAILVLLLLISPIELRRHEDEDDDDNYELSDLLKERFNQYQHRGKPSVDQEETNTNDDGDDQYYSSSHRRTKTHPSRKKVLPDNVFDNEDASADDVTTRITSSADKVTKPTTNNKHDMSDSSVCTDKYDIKSEQLVKVKELTSGARMIRYTLVDKRKLSMGVTVKDECMSNCCAEKSCDLAMLSEQPTHNGYKCYLFACNGSCVLASHQDYTVMTLKTNSVQTKQESVTTTSTSASNVPRKSSFFRETSVIIFLVFGLVSTIILFVLLFLNCRRTRRHAMKFKNYSIDEDYLINGLYL